MKRLRMALIGAFTVAALGVVGVGIGQAEDDAATAIAKRQALMRAQGGHMKAVNDFVESGAGDAKAVMAAAMGLSATADDIPGLFPQGTGMDDGVGKTGAKAAIWQEWDKFEAASKTLEAEALKLFQVASAGDKAAIAEQFGAVGKVGCGGCHEPYRQKLD